MSKLTLTLEEGEHIIFLEDAGDGCPEGYYMGECAINTPIYSRGTREEAMVLNARLAIEIMDSFLDLGYLCKAEPPIKITKEY